MKLTRGLHVLVTTGNGGKSMTGNASGGAGGIGGGSGGDAYTWVRKVVRGTGNMLWADRQLLSMHSAELPVTLVLDRSC